MRERFACEHASIRRHLSAKNLLFGVWSSQLLGILEHIATAVFPAASFTHRRNRFALICRSRATPAVEAPGSRQTATASALKTAECRRRCFLSLDCISVHLFLVDTILSLYRDPRKLTSADAYALTALPDRIRFSLQPPRQHRPQRYGENPRRSPGHRRRAPDLQKTCLSD